MKACIYFFVAGAIILGSVITTAESYNVICYFASWAVYRNGSGKFDVPSIDPNLCTHVNFAFVELYADGSLVILDPWESNGPNDQNPGHYDGFNKLVALKNTNPSLKVGVSIGGWNEGSKNFSIISADSVKRKRLAQESLALLEKYNFDSFDIDWEYPTLRDSSDPADKENFIALLKDFSEILKPKGKLLTAAVAGAVDKVRVAYDVNEMMKYLDMIHLMTYDYHGAFDNFVGHVSPLHASPLDYEHGRNSTYTVATGLEYWLYKEVDPSKINMGLALYGRTFTLEDPTNTALYAPISGPGERGEYSGLAGSLSYNEICHFYSGSESTYYWDDDQKVPHRVQGDQWIGYEDERSLQIKVDYGVNLGIGGFMIWALDNDDFMGQCGDLYPLTSAIKNRVKYHENKNKNNQ